MASQFVMSLREFPFSAPELERFVAGCGSVRVQEGFDTRGMIIRADVRPFTGKREVIPARDETGRFFVHRLFGKNSLSVPHAYEEILSAARALVHRSETPIRPATVEELVRYRGVAGRSLAPARLDRLVALATEFFWPDQRRVAHPVLVYQPPDEEKEHDPDAGIWLSSRNTGPEYWPGFHRYLFVSCL